LSDPVVSLVRQSATLSNRSSGIALLSRREPPRHQVGGLCLRSETGDFYGSIAAIGDVNQTIAIWLGNFGVVRMADIMVSRLVK
jgi:hypothetical protein